MINVGEAALSLESFAEIMFKGKPVGLDAKALDKVAVNFRFLQDSLPTS